MAHLQTEKISELSLSELSLNFKKSENSLQTAQTSYLLVFKVNNHYNQQDLMGKILLSPTKQARWKLLKLFELWRSIEGRVFRKPIRLVGDKYGRILRSNEIQRDAIEPTGGGHEKQSSKTAGASCYHALLTTRFISSVLAAAQTKSPASHEGAGDLAGESLPGQRSRIGHGNLALAIRCISWRRFPWLLAAAVVMIALLAEPMYAQTESDSSDLNREYVIKAAYLYQFARYVEWPDSAFQGADAPLIIGVLGVNPFGSILDEIAQTKKIDAHPIVIRQFSSMAEYTPCHILFISSSIPQKEREAAIQKTRGSAVLLVGEDTGFAEQGGTVNFFIDQNKIRFEINAETARQDRLKISSKLLSLAKIVGRY